MTYGDVTKQSPETQAAIEQEVRVLLKVRCSRLSQNSIKKVHDVSISSNRPPPSRTRTNVLRRSSRLTARSTRHLRTPCYNMKLWTPKRSRWCWRANRWTTRYLSRYFNILYRVYIYIYEAVQTCTGPFEALVFIRLYPSYQELEDDSGIIDVHAHSTHFYLTGFYWVHVFCRRH